MGHVKSFLQDVIGQQPGKILVYAFDFLCMRMSFHAFAVCAAPMAAPTACAHARARAHTHTYRCLLSETCGTYVLATPCHPRDGQEQRSLQLEVCLSPCRLLS